MLSPADANALFFTLHFFCVDPIYISCRDVQEDGLDDMGLRIRNMFACATGRRSESAGRHRLPSAAGKLLELKASLRREYKIGYCLSVYDALQDGNALLPQVMKRALDACATTFTLELPSVCLLLQEKNVLSDIAAEAGLDATNVLSKYLWAVPSMPQYYVVRETTSYDSEGETDDDDLIDGCSRSSRSAAREKRLGQRPDEQGGHVVARAHTRSSANPFFISFVGGDGTLLCERAISHALTTSKGGISIAVRELNPSNRGGHTEHRERLLLVLRKLRRDVRGLVAAATLETLRSVANGRADPRTRRHAIQCAHKLVQTNEAMPSSQVTRLNFSVYFISARGRALFAAGLVNLTCGSFPPRSFTLAPVTDGDDDEEGNTDVRSKAFAVVCGTNIPFWCSVRVLENKSGGVDVSVVLYHPVGTWVQRQRSLVTEHVRAAVLSLSNRVNAALLLDRLHATRVCSEFLVARTRRDDGLARRGSRDAPRTNMPVPVFSPGEFACPLQRSLRLPLHARLPAEVAIAHLQKAMRSLAVANRRNMFVYKTAGDDDAVFYFRLVQEVNAEAETSSLSLPPSPANRAVLLQVFGIDPPREAVANNLFEALQDRLGRLLVSMLCSHLDKNPAKCNLTTMDLQFVTCQTTPLVMKFPLPRRSAAFMTGSDIIFTRLLRKNLFFLSELHGGECRAFAYWESASTGEKGRGKGLGVAIVNLEFAACGGIATGEKSAVELLPAVTCKICARGSVSPSALMSRVYLSLCASLCDLALANDYLPLLEKHYLASPFGTLEPVLAVLGSAASLSSPSVLRFGFDRAAAGSSVGAQLITRCTMPAFIRTLVQLVATPVKSGGGPAFLTVVEATGWDHGHYYRHFARTDAARSRYRNSAAFGNGDDEERRSLRSLIRDGPTHSFSIFCDAEQQAFFLAAVSTRRVELSIYGLADHNSIQRRINKLIGSVATRAKIERRSARRKMGLHKRNKLSIRRRRKHMDFRTWGSNHFLL